jgi:hypothetical protein
MTKWLKLEYLLVAVLALFLAGPPLWWAGEAMRDAYRQARIQLYSLK